MDRRQLMLAALSAGGQHATFSPVQTQKLFFLIDREAAHLFDGPHFNFEPYDYGPFDRSVYDSMDMLSAAGLVRIQSSGRYRVYSLSGSGFTQGQTELANIAPAARDYLERIVRWITSLNFQQLVTAIYARYPDMKVNSVFR